MEMFSDAQTKQEAKHPFMQTLTETGTHKTRLITTM